MIFLHEIHTVFFFFPLEQGRIHLYRVHLVIQIQVVLRVKRVLGWECWLGGLGATRLSRKTRKTRSTNEARIPRILSCSSGIGINYS
jgi:hypothetical protein